MIYDRDQEDWRNRALCKAEGVGADAFFSERGERANEIALNCCGRCGVRDDCLDYAVENRELRGIWGGKTPGERRVIRRERMAARG